MKKSTLRAIAETVGKVFNSNSFGKFTVTSYEHSTRVYEALMNWTISVDD